MRHDFFTALTLLTIFPVPGRVFVTGRAPSKALAWFPLVGLALGAVLAAAFALARLVLPDLPAAALVVALWAFLTGALHLDGLADCGDGLAATASRERRLEIMHDPRVGGFGVVTVGLVLLCKFAAIATLRDPFILILAPVLARWAMVMAMVFPLARAEGMAARWRDSIGRTEPVIATLCAALVAGVFEWRGLAGWVSASLVLLVMARLALKRLGGLNGDVYGAIGEITETAVLIIGTAAIG